MSLVKRKKKYNLELDEATPFDMIGICSHHSDYRLVWGINNSLGIQLAKSNEEHVVHNKKGEKVSSHPRYMYYDPSDRLEYFFIKNKSNGAFLIPEKPTIDYFLFLNDNIAFEVQDFAVRLRDVQSILGVYIFNPDEITSAENLEFS